MYLLLLLVERGTGGEYFWNSSALHRERASSQCGVCREQKNKGFGCTGCDFQSTPGNAFIFTVESSGRKSVAFLVRVVHDGSEREAALLGWVSRVSGGKGQNKSRCSGPVLMVGGGNCPGLFSRLSGCMQHPSAAITRVGTMYSNDAI